MKKIAEMFDRLNNLMAAVAGVLLFCMMLFVGLSVVMRYFVNRPIAWGIELTEYSLLWFTFLAATWLLRTDRHVRMGIIMEQFGPKAQAAVEIITSTLSAMMFLIFALYGARSTWDSFARGLYTVQSVLRIPSGFILVIIPVASFMLFVQCLRGAWNELCTLRRSHGQETPFTDLK